MGTKKISKLDEIEQEPLFAIFIEAIYRDAIKNPSKLKDGSQIFNEREKNSSRMLIQKISSLKI